MNFEPGQIKKAQGMLAIILGILLAIIPISFIFRAFGIILLLVALPNFLATVSALNQKNAFVTVVFVKSLLLVAFSVILLIWPEQVGVFSIGAGIILLLGTYLEYRTSVDNKKYLKKEYWLIILSVVLIIMGGFSFISTVLEVIKYIIAILLVIFGVVMICRVPKPVDNFDEQLNEYERRYQETYGAKQNNDSEVIEATYEENDDEEEKND